MKTPSGGWRHTTEEDWLLSLTLMAFPGKLPSGMPFFSHEEDSKVLEQCLRLREVQALGTLSFPAKRIAPLLAQEDKAPAREFFVAAQGQSRWLQPTQETLEEGVALPDPGEKKRGFSSKVLDLKGRQEYLDYLLPKKNEHSEIPEETKQECD